ncbi:MAG: hypothetical protein V7746_26685 [Halioglobus sp.]
MMTRGPVLASAAFLSLLLLTPPLAYCAEAPSETDPESGLRIAPGWEAVKTHCTVCHSAKIVTSQRGDRDSWTAMVRWMQNTQGLWQFDPETENSILTYLAVNYPPGNPGRRKNLPPGDLP